MKRSEFIEINHRLHRLKSMFSAYLEEKGLTFDEIHLVTKSVIIVYATEKFSEQVLIPEFRRFSTSLNLEGRSSHHYEKESLHIALYFKSAP